MSYYYTKIKTLINDQKNSITELNDYYTEYTISKLTETKNPMHNSFLLYSDLVTHLQTNIYNKKKMLLHKIDKTMECTVSFTSDNVPYTVYDDNDKVISEIKNRLFYLKSLHLRAIILDLVENDYVSDDTFYKPDKWIYDVMEDLECTFDGMVEYMKEFNEVFMDTCKVIFICMNKKFGYNGNLLVMNFLIYKRWADERFECNYSEFFQCLFGNFSEGRKMEESEIMKILEEYENSLNKEKK